MKYLTLAELTEHPKNVRAKVVHSPESIAALAASIEALGLLQTLVVQEVEDGSYGVLAGRRRLLALRLLEAEDRLDARFKAPCKVIGKDVDHVTAVSLAENAMQEPMAPLDEYEAFAAMAGEGSTVEQIAVAFGATIRAVKERLRYGLVHPDIREAARNGEISLDTMKAYAGHPCQETQARVFTGFAENPADHSSWRVRDALMRQDIRIDDPLGEFVIERYRAEGGAVVAGLFDEDTVLTDRHLAERLRDERLMEEAVAMKARYGFKWAETRAQYDHAELAGYGRIYPKLREMSIEEQERFNANVLRIEEIAMRLEELAGMDDPDDGDNGAIATEADELSAEYERLDLENDSLREAYDPEDAKRAGVIACFSHGTVRFECGLLRPEDALAPEEETARGNAPARGDVADGSDAPARPVLSNALRGDLAVERAGLLAAALAEDRWLARDVLIFQLAATLFSPMHRMRGAIAISANTVHGDHSRPEAMLPEAADRLTAARDALDLSCFDAGLTGAEQFEAFRALGSQEKGRILAFVVAMQVTPQLWSEGDADGLAEAVYVQAIPNIRTVWRPTAAGYWSRVSKGHMLDVLHALGMPDQSREWGAMKKAVLAEQMEKLFAEPPKWATLQQHMALREWTPEGMQAPAPDPARDDVGEDAEAASVDEAETDPEAGVAEETSDPEIEEAAA